MDPLATLLSDDELEDPPFDLPRRPDPDAALPDDEEATYPDWDRENSFVIAGPLANHPARTPSEEGRRRRCVREARAWALEKYGQLFEDGRNLELLGSGRYAFRVRRPTKET